MFLGRLSETYLPTLRSNSFNLRLQRNRTLLGSSSSEDDESPSTSKKKAKGRTRKEKPREKDRDGDDVEDDNSDVDSEGTYSESLAGSDDVCFVCSRAFHERGGFSPRWNASEN